MKTHIITIIYNGILAGIEAHESKPKARKRYNELIERYGVPDDQSTMDVYIEYDITVKK
jgi:hypothetical protein